MDKSTKPSPTTAKCWNSILKTCGRNSRSKPCRKSNSPCGWPMQDALEGLTSVRYSSRFVSRFQRENAAEHVHSHVFVSMAAKRYARNEGAGGARDSRLAGADPGAARDELWR